MIEVHVQRAYVIKLAITVFVIVSSSIRVVCEEESWALGSRRGSNLRYAVAPVENFQIH